MNGKSATTTAYVQNITKLSFEQQAKLLETRHKRQVAMFESILKYDPNFLDGAELPPAEMN